MFPMWKRPAAWPSLTWQLRGEKLCGVPGPLTRTAAFHASQEAVVTNLTFKYNQVLALLEPKAGFGQ